MCILLYKWFSALYFNLLTPKLLVFNTAFHDESVKYNLILHLRKLSIIYFYIYFGLLACIGENIIKFDYENY